jgi:hypothetical protein
MQGSETQLSLVRPDVRPGRILYMSINIPARAFRLPPPVGTNADRKAQRDQRIHDMATSLLEMFGSGALSVADSQPGLNDVSGNSGIRWLEVSKALGALHR